MNKHLLTLLAGCVVATVAAAPSPAFQGPLEVHAAKSALALRAPLNAAASAGGRLIVAGQRGHILYSDDGGTWTQAEVPVSSDIVALYFSTPTEGWAVGHEGVVLHTSDGGTTWTLQLDGKRIGALMRDHYAKLAQSTDEAAQRVARDAEAFAEQGADKPLLDVWFEDAKHGFVIGAFSLILRTEDGGQSWTPWSDRIDNPNALHLYSIRPAAGGVFIVGEQGLVLKLDAARQRFVQVALPYQGTLFGVVGTASTAIVFGLRGNVFRTTDGGANWSKVETGVDAGISSGVVRGDGAVVLASQTGHLFVSSDAGASLRRTNTAVVAPIFALAETKGGVVLAGLGGVRAESVK